MSISIIYSYIKINYRIYYLIIALKMEHLTPNKESDSTRGDASVTGLSDTAETHKITTALIGHDPNVAKGGDSIEKAKTETDQIATNTSSTTFCTLNQKLERVNKIALSRLQGQQKDISSIDVPSIDGDSLHLLSTEAFLNETPTIMPPHILSLKEGAPIMLTIDLDKREGLCNGTRMQVIKAGDNILRCRLLTGPRVGKEVLLFKTKFTYGKPNHRGIPFTRIQFPVRLCFSMSLNKEDSEDSSFAETYDSITDMGEEHAIAESSGDTSVAVMNATAETEDKITSALIGHDSNMAKGDDSIEKAKPADKVITASIGVENASVRDTAFKCPVSINDAKQKLEILQTLLMETIAKKKAKEMALPELMRKQEEIIKQEIGLIGWTRGIKRQQANEKLIKMENSKCEDVAAKKSRLSKEQTELDQLKAEHIGTVKTMTEVNLLCSQQIIVKNCQTEVSTTIKKWEDQIKQAKKVTAIENEKLDKESLRKEDLAIKPIHTWRANYDKREIQPLRTYVAEIVKAKKSLHKFLKEENLDDPSFAEASASFIDMDEEHNADQSFETNAEENETLS